jgi:hypothetical protein
MNNRARAAALAAAVIAVAGAAVTGCSSPPAPAAPASPAAARPPAAAPATPAMPPASPTAVTAAAGGAVPVLGRLAGVFDRGTGFGQARPAKIFNGGDPTGLVTKITWHSWGGPQATGSGTSEYVGPGRSVATGTAQPVTIVAFKLGTCHGTRM